MASGMHARLGAASGVSWLDEQSLVMIADEVLGSRVGSSLLKEWWQELVAANVRRDEDVVSDPSNINSEVLSDNAVKHMQVV
jgi:hypothetical protein